MCQVCTQSVSLFVPADLPRPRLRLGYCRRHGLQAADSAGNRGNGVGANGLAGFVESRRAGLGRKRANRTRYRAHDGLSACRAVPLCTGFRRAPGPVVGWVWSWAGPVARSVSSWVGPVALQIPSCVRSRRSLGPRRASGPGVGRALSRSGSRRTSGPVVHRVCRSRWLRSCAGRRGRGVSVRGITASCRRGRRCCAKSAADRRRGISRRRRVKRHDRRAAGWSEGGRAPPCRRAVQSPRWARSRPYGLQVNRYRARQERSGECVGRPHMVRHSA